MRSTPPQGAAPEGIPYTREMMPLDESAECVVICAWDVSKMRACGLDDLKGSAGIGPEPSGACTRRLARLDIAPVLGTIITNH